MADTATPYSTPIPGVSGYGQAALLAKTAYANTLARLNQKRQQTLQQYGYLGDINPDSGVIQNVRVDPHNQYGNLQTMLRSNALEDRQAHFAAQDRGLHGGLAHQGESELRYNHGATSANLGITLTNALSDFQDQQTQGAYERDMALWQAEQLAARDAIANQAFNPADNSATSDTTTTSSGADSGPVTHPFFTSFLHSLVGGTSAPTHPFLTSAQMRALLARYKPSSRPQGV